MSYKDDALRAGAIAKEVLVYGSSLIVKGAKYMDVYAKILHKIHELGAVPAFPPQMALDEVAAHFLPEIGEDIVFDKQVVSLDIGVAFNGAIGDTAMTIDLSGKQVDLLKATHAGLAKALEHIRVGATLGEIGAHIQDTIESYGFRPITNLCGHGLGLNQIHVPPTIPNYDNGSKVQLKPDLHFAIEPFATSGVGRIRDTSNPQIFSLVHKRPLRSKSARDVLAQLNSFGTLPFSTHDLHVKGLSAGTIKLGLKELLASGCVIGHAPLIEESRAIVAQFEHTVYIDESGKVYITTK